jgi:hypothetical protein
VPCRSANGANDRIVNTISKFVIISRRALAIPIGPTSACLAFYHRAVICLFSAAVAAVACIPRAFVWAALDRCAILTLILDISHERTFCGNDRNSTSLRLYRKLRNIRWGFSCKVHMCVLCTLDCALSTPQFGEENAPNHPLAPRLTRKATIFDI